MDVKLDSLIERIKKDGILEAKKQSEEIISGAKEEAKAIIAKARIEATAITKQAQDQANKLKNNTEKALKQAARDLLLNLKSQIDYLLAGLLKQSVAKELEPQLISELIIKIVENWSKEKDSVLEVSLNKADKQKVETLLRQALKDKAKDKIEIRVNKSIDKGFQIGIKGQDLYYDFTDQALSETFKELLSPAIKAILDKK